MSFCWWFSRVDWSHSFGKLCGESFQHCKIPSAQLTASIFFQSSTAWVENRLCTLTIIPYLQHSFPLIIPHVPICCAYFVISLHFSVDVQGFLFAKQVLKRPNVFEYLHVPVQSGSDAVLRAMVREYTRAEFQRLVDGLRAEVPEIFIGTDAWRKGWFKAWFFSQKNHRAKKSYFIIKDREFSNK